MDCDGFAGGFQTALSGYSAPVVWMIFCAFHIGTAFSKTRLGERISLLLIRWMGRNVFGLGLAIMLSEFVLGPFVPSNTARGGGIVLPIVKSLISAIEEAQAQPQSTSKFLILVGAHSNLLISSLFITGAAPNPIVARLVHQILDIKIGFLDWFVAAIAPAAFSGLILLLFFSWTQKPEYDSQVVLEAASERYSRLGPLSRNEMKLIGVLLISLGLWTTTSLTHLTEALIAFMALLGLLLLQILKWEDIIKNEKAWDTFFWLAGMLLMAEQLSKLGFSTYIGTKCQQLVTSITSNPWLGMMLFGACYFVSMYMFSSITGHAVSFAGPFLMASKAFGRSEQIAYMLMYFTSLSACLTPFSTGSVVLYFSQGYFTQSEWFRLGGAIGLIYLVIYCAYFSIP
jgi:DASS family divalent anion:Na+ symporter